MKKVAGAHFYAANAYDDMYTATAKLNKEQANAFSLL